jgi:hypothetical protein
MYFIRVSSFSPHSPTTRSNLSPSHRSIIATTSPTGSASPGTTSAPDLGAAATEDDGNPLPGLHEEMDALDPPGPPSVNRAIHASAMSTPDLPLQSPLLRSTSHSDVAIAGSSPREPNAEHPVDRPPEPPSFRYDIVQHVHQPLE